MVGQTLYSFKLTTSASGNDFNNYSSNNSGLNNNYNQKNQPNPSKAEYWASLRRQEEYKLKRHKSISNLLNNSTKKTPQ
jgi:hypothetical protein